MTSSDSDITSLSPVYFQVPISLVPKSVTMNTPPGRRMRATSAIVGRRTGDFGNAGCEEVDEFVAVGELVDFEERHLARRVSFVIERPWRSQDTRRIGDGGIAA